MYWRKRAFSFVHNLSPHIEYTGTYNYLARSRTQNTGIVVGRNQKTQREEQINDSHNHFLIVIQKHHVFDNKADRFKTEIESDVSIRVEYGFR